MLIQLVPMAQMTHTWHANIKAYVLEGASIMTKRPDGVR